MRFIFCVAAVLSAAGLVSAGVALARYVIIFDVQVAEHHNFHKVTPSSRFVSHLLIQIIHKVIRSGVRRFAARHILNPVFHFNGPPLVHIAEFQQEGAKRLSIKDSINYNRHYLSSKLAIHYRVAVAAWNPGPGRQRVASDNTILTDEVLIPEKVEKQLRTPNAGFANRAGNILGNKREETCGSWTGRWLCRFTGWAFIFFLLWNQTC